MSNIAAAFAVFVLCMPAWRAAAGPGAEEDWAAVLGDAAVEGMQTEVVGMSAEEAAAYAVAETAEAEADEEIADSFVRNRRRFVLREVRFDTDWDCDPTAVPALVDQFRRRTGMDAQALLPRNPLRFDAPELLDWPFLYMTAHYAFTFSEAEERGLRSYIERGGFIWADDCLYGQTFGPTFQAMLERAFPESVFAPVDPAHPVLGMVYKQKYTFQSVHESGIPRVFRNANPWCAVVHGGYLSVGYSPQDIGCAWEISSPPTPSNPLGAGMHSMDMMPGVREAAYRLGVNIMLYSMLH